MKVSFEIPKEYEDKFKAAYEDHKALKDVKKVIHINVYTKYHFIGDLNININEFKVEEENTEEQVNLLYEYCKDKLYCDYCMAMPCKNKEK